MPDIKAGLLTDFRETNVLMTNVFYHTVWFKKVSHCQSYNVVVKLVNEVIGIFRRTKMINKRIVVYDLVLNIPCVA